MVILANPANYSQLQPITEYNFYFLYLNRKYSENHPEANPKVLDANLWLLLYDCVFRFCCLSLIPPQFHKWQANRYVKLFALLLSPYLDPH